MKIKASPSKKTVITNLIIVAMFITLIGFSVSNSIALSASADNRVIYSGDEQSTNVSFMINVYQNENFVLDMLDIMDKYNVKTTFFVGGTWAVKNIDIIKEIYARGHEIGNHGFYHKDQDKLSYEENYQEINMCHKVIKENLGLEMTLFAPPSGAYNKTTVDVATELNYKTIMWTHDTIDWRDKDADLIFKRATNNLSNGDLILMHPTEHSVIALTNILSFAVNNGFTPTTVSNCLQF